MKKDIHENIWKWGALLLGALVIAFVAAVVLLALVVAVQAVTPKVGVVPIKGEISGDSYQSTAGLSPGAYEIIRMIKDADSDPSVKVIMLDINSGGGSVVASKEIARAVRETEKPVVAYIGEMGASGAYYIAAASDVIVCDEDSMTGSIGVLSEFPNYMGLMEKVGVNMTVMTSGEMKAAGNPFEEFTPEQKERYMVLLKDAFANFKRDVTEYRPGVTGLDELSDGRVVNGRQAFAYGLVDELGSRSVALKRAAELGGIEGEPEEKLFSAYGNPFAGMFASAGYEMASGFKRGLAADTGMGVVA
jgi:protease-4